MATAAQLRQYEEERRAHEARVAGLKKQMQQSLDLAAAQLAVTMVERRWLDQDITQRATFDPDVPSEALSPDERRQLPEAQRIMQAIAAYIDGNFRLQNQSRPRVFGRGVIRGRL